MVNNIYVIQDSLSHQISEPFSAANEQVALRIFDRAIASANIPEKLLRDTDLVFLGTIEVLPDGHVVLRGVEAGQRICSGNDPCFRDVEEVEDYEADEENF